jgi:hypothetical protein
MTNALVPFAELSLSDTVVLGKTLAASGYFQDTREAAQAVVKILAGRELGFGPIASMTGIYIVKGRVTLSANLIAAAVKGSGRYNYRVTKHDAEICSITFYEGGEIIGTSTFSMNDAAQAGLGGDNWKKYPRNMLFARAMSNGAKWYCADVFGGPVYTPDELGAPVDGETGEVIDMPAAPADANAATAELFGDYDPDPAEAQREVADLGLDDAPAETVPTAARTWPKVTLQAVMDANLAKPAKHAITMLNLSDVLRTTDDVSLVLQWGRAYKEARKDHEPPEAAKMADKSLEGLEGDK